MSKHTESARAGGSSRRGFLKTGASIAGDRRARVPVHPQRPGGGARAALARLGALQRQGADRGVRAGARGQGLGRLLRRQLRGLQQAARRRHPGLRSGHGRRLLAAPLRQAGPDPAGRLRQARQSRARVPGLPAAQLHAAPGRGRLGDDRRAQLLGRLRLHRQYRSGRGGGPGDRRPAVQREVRGPPLDQRPLRGEHRARRHSRRPRDGHDRTPSARTASRSIPTS